MEAESANRSYLKSVFVGRVVFAVAEVAFAVEVEIVGVAIVLMIEALVTEIMMVFAVVAFCLDGM